jgi:poly-gamma-glutamate capsule biosynthesis protein CapA/YwtB (metallophosphatase superfamily)
VARALGIGAATLANNHVFDFGVDTRARLERAGIACCGAGDGPAHAAAPLQISIAGRETAFIGWADRSTINGVWAEDGCSGAYAAPPESLLDQVDALASRVDHVVVLPHWGRDFIKYPSPAMRELGRRLVDAGASAVVGTHPHVLGCSERHAQRPIVYSTGSLLLDDILMPDGSLAWAFVPCLSVVALIELTEDEPRVDFATFRCSRGRFEMLAPERGKARLERNSRFLGRPDYDRAYARHEARMRAWGIHLQSLRRPGATARRVGRKIARLAGSGP